MGAIRATLAERELELTDLRSQLAVFESRYIRQIGILYADFAGELPGAWAKADHRGGGRLSWSMPVCGRAAALPPGRSGPALQELRQWMKAQFAEHRVAPTSEPGKAFSYLLNHWTKLTLFLSQPGAPLDNNILERAIKKAILNRRNALFYKTLNGAALGDLFMSLAEKDLLRPGGTDS